MGRRPNPIVAEFYERGAKLPDNSNRYAATCKRCGEEFPKGRLDSLTSHLLRKCPSVTQEDREWVFQQIQQNPERGSNAGKQTAPDTSSNVQKDMFGTPTFLQQPSALDTLAEVSRHYSTRRSNNDSDTSNSSKAFNDTFAEQALLTELRGHADLKSPTYPLPSMNSRNDAAQASSPQVSSSPEQLRISVATEVQSPLVHTASAANHQIELEKAQNSVQGNDKSQVDPQLQELRRNAHTDPHGAGNDTYMPTWRPAISSIAPRPTDKSTKSPDGSSTPLGTLHAPAQAKKRGRFDDNRRKQVSDLRKRGACIRCRMLKKPCSGDTPCSTCRTVESARLWKGTCVRTRLADEFTLYSTNLFHARAKIDAAAAIHGLSQVCLPGMVDVRFQSDSSNHMSFTAIPYSEIASNGDTDRSKYFALSRIESTSIWALDEGEVNADKLENFFDQNVHELVEHEPSTFMRTTLKQVQELISTEETLKKTKVPGEQEKRTSYNLQHELLKTLTKLWILTRLLTSSDSISLQLRYNVQLLHDGSDPVERAIQQISWNIPSTSQSYQLIQVQLLTAVEARASKLSKAAINELERRLLQRQQVSRFGTFLAAVLLLSCAERMCAFYYGFDVGEEHLHQQNAAERHPLNGSRAGSSAHSKKHSDPWPLDTPPLYLWSQGQSFADLLSMLLRMRALPSSTARKTNGMLAGDNNFNGILAGANSSNGQIDEHDNERAWLESLRSSASEVASTIDGAPPVKEGADAWHMRLVSRLLWPSAN